MPNRQNNDKFSELHSFTLVVKAIPKEFEVQSIAYFGQFTGGNNGYTGLHKVKVRVKKERVKTMGTIYESTRLFLTTEVPFKEGDDIYVRKAAISKYYISDQVKSDNDVLSLYLDDVVGYKERGSKSFKPFGGYVLGYPEQSAINIKGHEVMNLAVLQPRLSGLFKDFISKRVLIGYNRNNKKEGDKELYPFFNIVSREGYVKKCYHYPETSFYGTVENSQVTPLPGRYFIEYEKETLKLIMERKPLLTGMVIAGDKWVGKRVVFDLYMHPFQYYEKGKKYEVISVMEENIRIVF